MKFDRSIPVWRACDQEGSRPLLEHVLIERTSDTSGLLVASDGFMLAVAPCTLRPDETVGLVHRDVFPKAIKAAGRKETHPEIVFDAPARLVLADGTVLARVEPDGTFPNWRDRRIHPQRLPLRRRYRGAVALSPVLLAQLGEALGYTRRAWDGEGPHGLTLTFGRTHADAVLVERERPSVGDGAPTPPYGILMPMSISSLHHPDAVPWSMNGGQP